jgi:hypothetical protein
VCVSRNIEFIGADCFDNSCIHFFAGESQSHLLDLDSSCFEFVTKLELFSHSGANEVTGNATSGTESRSARDFGLEGNQSCHRSLPREEAPRRLTGDSTDSPTLFEQVTPASILRSIRYSSRAFADCRSLSWICIPK